MSYGKMIQKLITERNISEKELCSALNISLTTLEKWIREEKLPDIKTIASAARFFGVSSDELLCIDTSDRQLPNDGEFLSAVRELSDEQRSMLYNEMKNQS